MLEPSSFAFTTYYDERKKSTRCKSPPPTRLRKAPLHPLLKNTSRFGIRERRAPLTRRVVEDCDLKAIGMSRVRGVNDVRSGSVFDQYPAAERCGIRQSESHRNQLSGGADVLIGMDIIGAGERSATMKGARRSPFVALHKRESTSCLLKNVPRNSARNNPCP